MLDDLAKYLFKRMCLDQELLSNKKGTIKMFGLYIRPKDIERYIMDYIDSGKKIKDIST